MNPVSLHTSKGYSVWELAIVLLILGLTLMVAGPSLVRFQRVSKSDLEKIRVIGDYTSRQIQQLEKDPARASEISNQMSARFPGFRSPAILLDHSPNQAAADVKIGILEFRISKLEDAIDDNSRQVPWWVLLVVIPSLSALMGRLFNPLFDYLGIHLKSLAQKKIDNVSNRSS